MYDSSICLLAIYSNVENVRATYFEFIFCITQIQLHKTLLFTNVNSSYITYTKVFKTNFDVLLNVKYICTKANLANKTLSKLSGWVTKHDS